MLQADAVVDAVAVGVVLDVAEDVVDLANKSHHLFFFVTTHWVSVVVT